MSPGVLRSSAWDAPLVVLTLVYGAALVVAPSIPLIAVGSWWTANTIAHNFIHRPFFTSSSLNRLFSLLLTAIAGVPQIVWQQRHLAHHAGRRWRPQWSGPLAGELVIVGLLWTTLVLAVPGFFITVYAPGCLVGLLLCAIQGHYEHARGTTSHYGRLYNLLCCNDGYHAEHHARPGVHWTLLPELVEPGARSSRWPSLLRWLDGSALELLERLVLRSRTLQNFVLRCHRRACRRLLRQIPPAARVAIVGGGLFPRTALILRELLPAARLVIIDADAEHLETARAMLAGRPEGLRLSGSVEFVHRRYRAAGEPEEFDLVVIPLSFQGERAALYREPPAGALLVHDWLWRRRGASCIVSPLLLKRLNLVRA